MSTITPQEAQQALDLFTEHGSQTKAARPYEHDAAEILVAPEGGREARPHNHILHQSCELRT
jgi:hypothetical protein